ncbi:hypothetical protein RDABS01_012015 [Bienertia sinuspersici]
MEDKENHEKIESGKKIKQEITVPFLWEEKPGEPRKDWQPKHEPLNPVPLPVKYIASVPFKWEEKPGTPLRSFARESTKRLVDETVSEKGLPLPPAYFSKYENESDEDDSSYGDDSDDFDWLSELDWNPNLEQQNVGDLEGSFKEEVSSNSNDYAVRNTSLKGAAFLAHLFPLYPPKSAFLEPRMNHEEKMRIPEKISSVLVEHNKVAGDGRRSGVIRRPCTLGELILQSRRRSFRRLHTEQTSRMLQSRGQRQRANECSPEGLSGDKSIIGEHFFFFFVICRSFFLII